MNGEIQRLLNGGRYFRYCGAAPDCKTKQQAQLQTKRAWTKENVIIVDKLILSKQDQLEIYR